jgi:hypothetical protein
VLLVDVSSDNGRPRGGAGAACGGDSVSVSVTSVRLRRSSSADSEGSGGSAVGSCCNTLRRCNKRAVVDDWTGGVIAMILEEGGWARGVAL